MAQADDSDTDARRARAHDVLVRLHAACGGSVEREVSFSRAATDIGLDYLGTRSVLGTMLQERWIVRHGRDAVTLTPHGIDEAIRLASTRD